MKKFLRTIVVIILGNYRDALYRESILHGFGLIDAISQEADALLKGANQAHKSKRNGKRVLLVTGYYFSRRSLLLDVVFAIHLKARGFEVVGLTPGSFFENECPLFEPYRRGEKLRINSALEKYVWRRILRLRLVDIGKFAKKEDRKSAQKAVQDLRSISAFRDFAVEGIPVGEEGYLVAINLSSKPRLAGTPEEISRVRTHVTNALRYLYAVDRFFSAQHYAAIVSQYPFYYKWSIPSRLARKRGIPHYSYTPGDTEGTVIFGKNTAWFQGSDTPVSRVVNTSRNIDPVSDLEATNAFLEILESPGRLGHTRDGSNTWKNRINWVGDLSPARIDRAWPERKKRVFVPLNVHCDLVTLQGSAFFGDYVDFLEHLVHIGHELTPHFEFLVKIHPAEELYQRIPGWRGCKEILLDLGWDERVGPLIPYTDDIPVKAYLAQSDVVLSWSSTVNLEAVAMGLPVVQLGYSHVYEADFIHKPSSLQELGPLLSDLVRSVNHNDSGRTNERTNGARYGLMHYRHIQTRVGFLEGTEISQHPLRASTTRRELAFNPVYEEVVEKIDEEISVFPIIADTEPT